MAYDCGVHENTVRKCLDPDSTVLDETLVTMGLRRISVYEWVGVLKHKPGFRKTHAVCADIGPDCAPEEDIVQTPLVSADLNTERVLTAVKYRVNPGRTWRAFIESGLPLTDNQWAQFCKRESQVNGAQQPVAVPRADTPVLYGHLKYVERGVDHRRQLQRGELPAAVKRVEIETTLAGSPPIK